MPRGHSRFACVTSTLLPPVKRLSVIPVSASCFGLQATDARCYGAFGFAESNPRTKLAVCAWLVKYRHYVQNAGTGILSVTACLQQLT
jgi:hypothetical protein